MNHPKGFTVDDRGNIYVADTMNMAIRKISDTGELKDSRWAFKPDFTHVIKFFHI